MASRNEKRDVADRLYSMFENLEGTPAEDLRMMHANLTPNAEAEEQEFIRQLRLMRSGLDTAPGEEAAGGLATAVKDEAPLRGLISEARKQGLTAAELADAAHLSVPLVTMLDLRLIRYVSIPRQVVEDVAGVIRRSTEQVALYLQGAPIRTAVAYSDTDASAESQEQQQDFLDAVNTDVSLLGERRARLSGMTSQ